MHAPTSGSAVAPPAHAAAAAGVAAPDACRATSSLHCSLWPPCFQWTFWHAAEQYTTPLHPAHRCTPGLEHPSLAHFCTLSTAAKPVPPPLPLRSPRALTLTGISRYRSRGGTRDPRAKKKKKKAPTQRPNVTHTQSAPVRLSDADRKRRRFGLVGENRAECVASHCRCATLANYLGLCAEEGERDEAILNCVVLGDCWTLKTCKLTACCALVSTQPLQ
jgi:hypothetical protein